MENDLTSRASGFIMRATRIHDEHVWTATPNHLEIMKACTALIQRVVHVIQRLGRYLSDDNYEGTRQYVSATLDDAEYELAMMLPDGYYM